MSNIELFPHNEEAYQALVKSLENSNFSFIERATGTGKSYILIKLMANLFQDKRVLFVTLHDSMFKQLSERDMKILGTSKDIYEKLDCVLYSSIPKHSARWYYDNYDCIIFDEAHHCGAPIWGERIGEIRDLFRDADDKKMIGATATGTRYLDNYRDVAEEYFDGNVASRLLLSEAILREILPAPFYINLNQNTIEILESIKKKLEKLDNYRELEPIKERVEEYENIIKQKTNIGNLLQKYGVKEGEKYIVFCETIKDLHAKQEIFKEYFKNIAPLEISEVHSKQSDEKNAKLIKDFEEVDTLDSVKLMFAVDMFNEGLHIKGVDGLFMTRRTSSPIIYLQQLGRALSFSSRKSQIKVFDLVGNATNIDVIHNLYKELLAISKEELAAGRGNQEHYFEIINRFKIVDEGLELVEELNAINNYLEENYFAREQISRCIFILKNYVKTYNCDFMELIRNKQMDQEHFNVYRRLQSSADKLSFNDLVELAELGIILTGYQNNSEVLEKIKKYGSYEKYKDNEVKEIIDEYNLFYIRNDRRPSDDNPKERELSQKYKDSICSLGPTKLKQYLKDRSYPYSLEELLLLRQYPSKEDIDRYLDMIESKYMNGIALDLLEKKTISIISKYMSLKDRPLLDDMANNIVIKLDESIRLFEEYLKTHPGEDFDNPNNYYSNSIKSAIRNLHRNHKYVTNIQFEKLLELGVKLPREIDMTIEERKERLGIYNSFYEKEKIKDQSELRAIQEFISLNKRKPLMDSNDEKERILAGCYKNFFNRHSDVWAKRIVDSLEANKVELTIDEKIMSSKKLEQSDLPELYQNVIDTLTNCNKEEFKNTLTRKKIRMLKKEGYIDDRLSKLFLKTCELIDELFDDRLKKYENYLKNVLYNNQSIVPFNLIPYIEEEHGIKMKAVIKNSIHKDTSINIAHKKYNEDIAKIEKYFSYIRENKKRPPEDSQLTSFFKRYLAVSSLDDINILCNGINSYGMELTDEELLLLGFATPDIKERLYKKLKNKLDHNEDLDKLDNKIYIFLNSERFSSDIKYTYHDTTLISVNSEIKSEAISEIKDQIRNNPDCVIDYDVYLLPTDEIKRMENYRTAYKGRLFVEDLIVKMQKEQKTYEELLSVDELKQLNETLKIFKETGFNIEMIGKLQNIDETIYLDKNKIHLEDFVNDYLDFINKNNRRPDSNSEDEVEKEIARKYELIKGVLSEDELNQFRNNTTRIIKSNVKKDFYSSFIDFIMTNERFPSVLGEPEEKELAEQYQKLGSRLPLDQRKEINKLRNKFQMNTIEYIKNRKGK